MLPNDLYADFTTRQFSLNPLVSKDSIQQFEFYNTLIRVNAVNENMSLITSTRFRNSMTQAGFTIAGTAHPICPVMLGDARLASIIADDMLKLGKTSHLTAFCNFIVTFYLEIVM